MIFLINTKMEAGPAWFTAIFGGLSCVGHQLERDSGVRGQVGEGGLASRWSVQMKPFVGQVSWFSSTNRAAGKR